MSEWQPIKSAPKDGSSILVYDHVDEIVMVVAWLDDNSTLRGRAIMCWCVPQSWQDEQGGYYTADHPTHWMELPEPPTREVSLP